MLNSPDSEWKVVVGEEVGGAKHVQAVCHTNVYGADGKLQRCGWRGSVQDATYAGRGVADKEGEEHRAATEEIWPSGATGYHMVTVLSVVPSR